MTLSATATATHVIDSNASTTVTLTPAANSLLLVFACGDEGTGSTNETLSVSGGGLTWNLGVRHNGSPGATAEIWWAQQPSSVSTAVAVADNKGSVSKAVKVVYITDSSGGIPVFGNVDSGGAVSNLNPVAQAAGAWAWALAFGGTNFTTLAGHTLQDHVDLADGFDGGDADAVYSLDGLATGPGALTISKSATTAHMVAVAIELPSAGAVVGQQSTSRHPGNGPTNARFYQSPRSTDIAATTTPIAVTDTGAAAESTFTVAATVPLVDAASGGDALAVTATITLADAGTGSDGLAIAATIALTDAGAASDALTVATTLPLTDTGAAADALVVSATVPLTDAGAASDAISVNTGATPVTLADTGAAADALTVTITVPLADTASAADTIRAVVSLALADAATSLQSLTAVGTIHLADTSTAADQIRFLDLGAVHAGRMASGTSSAGSTSATTGGTASGTSSPGEVSRSGAAGFGSSTSSGGPVSSG